MLPACDMLTLISVTPNISLTFLACPHNLTKGAPVVRITSISFKGAEASIHKFCAPVKKCNYKKKRTNVQEAVVVVER